MDWYLLFTAVSGCIPFKGQKWCLKAAFKDNSLKGSYEPQKIVAHQSLEVPFTNLLVNNFTIFYC